MKIKKRYLLKESFQHHPEKITLPPFERVEYLIGLMNENQATVT